MTNFALRKEVGKIKINEEENDYENHQTVISRLCKRGMETYYFGANLLAHILPENEKQPLIKVELTPPDGKEHTVTAGIYARSEVMAGIRQAKAAIEKANPDKIITIGGNCVVSLGAV